MSPQLCPSPVPQCSPIQYSGQFQSSKSYESNSAPGTAPSHSVAPLPERQDARNERLTPLYTLFSTEAPLPCPSHTRSHPPEAPGTPPFSLCPKKVVICSGSYCCFIRHLSCWTKNANSFPAVGSSLDLSSVLSAGSCYIGYLLLCDKFPQNLASQINKIFISHSF